MKQQAIGYEKSGHLAMVTIRRPEVMNALDPEAEEELAAVWDDFQRDPEAWVAILTGEGERAFCAGADLKHAAAHPEALHTGPRTGFGGLTSRLDLFKPLIAAVNGVAVGGGFEMALCCDLILAAEHARFGLPEVKVGLLATSGGVHRLPRSVPAKVAMEMLLTGRLIGARRAFELGLVNEVVPAERLMERACQTADEILACAPLAVRGTKQAALQGLDMLLARALDYPFPLVREAERSEDYIEGPRAFAEKRRPVWKGR